MAEKHKKDAYSWLAEKIEGVEKKRETMEKGNQKEPEPPKRKEVVEKKSSPLAEAVKYTRKAKKATEEYDKIDGVFTNPNDTSFNVIVKDFTSYQHLGRNLVGARMHAKQGMYGAALSDLKNVLEYADRCKDKKQERGLYLHGGIDAANYAAALQDKNYAGSLKEKERKGFAEKFEEVAKKFRDKLK